jgi:hypothetical protein
VNNGVINDAINGTDQGADKLEIKAYNKSIKEI